MKQLRDALIRAGLVQQEQLEESKSKKPRKKKHKDWRRKAYKNRFGQPATYEIWIISGLPSNYDEKCALCGKSLFDKVPWQAHETLTANICSACYVHGRKYDPEKFPPLEKECPSQFP